MQQYTSINGATLITQAPGKLMANIDTLLSSNEGTVFPSSNNVMGRVCYRSDQKKLYLMTDDSPATWKLISDLSKTYVTYEDCNTDFINKSKVTSSLTDTSTSKVASAKAVKTVQDNLNSHTTAYADFVGQISKSSASYIFSNNISLVRDAATLTVQGGAVGADNGERTSALQLGRSNSRAFNVVTHGTGYTFLGSGGLTSSRLPTHNAMRFAYGSNSVLFYGTVDVNGRLDANSGLNVNGSTGMDGNVTVDGTVAVTGQISSTGNITSGGTITMASDARLKSDIETIEGALDKVTGMRGVMYTLRSSGERRPGVIADELEKVLPEAVDRSGEYKSVAYQNLAGLLIQAIKELNDKVEAR